MATTLPGANPLYYNPSFGGIPQVPSPTSTAAQSIAGNLGNLSAIGQLGTGVTGQNVANSLAPLTSSLPGFSGALSTGMANVNSLMSGQIPGDIMTMLQQQNAERGVAGGMAPGAPANNTAMMKALGLTGLGLEQTGLSEFGSLAGLVPQPTLFNPQSMMSTPQAQQTAQESANVLSASPIPAAAAGTNMNSLMNALGLNRGTSAGLTGGTTGTSNPYSVYTTGEPSSDLGISLATGNVAQPTLSQILGLAAPQQKDPGGNTYGVPTDEYDYTVNQLGFDPEMFYGDGGY
jgi:hypothetical protein